MLAANYIKTAFRNLWKFKLYSLINISGLSIGMACCVLIMAWVGNELSFDRFHQNADRIYRILIDANLGSNIQAPVTNGPTGPAVKELYPEVEDFVRITGSESTPVKFEDRQFQEEDVTFADASIFSVFDFPLIQGNVETALIAANSVVLSEATAEKYFPNTDPMNNLITVNGVDYTVTGILKDFPSNSHLSFTMIRSIETLKDLNPQMMEEWMSFSMGTYLLLAENADPAALEAKFPELVNEHLGPILTAIGGSITFLIQPLNRIHLYSNMSIDVDNNGDIAQVYLFSVIALFVLLMACVNFINLSTARSAFRAKEVGIRKTLGGTRKQLTGQFLSESIILSLIAVLGTILILVLTFNKFHIVVGHDMELGFWTSAGVIPVILGLAVISGLLAGIYPAVYLSKFKPSVILGGNLRSGSSNSRLRQVLVVFQFVIPITLLVGTVTITNQLNYLNNKPLGFNKENILYITDVEKPGVPPIHVLKEEMKNVAGVIGVATSSRVPTSSVQKSVFMPEGFAEDEAQTMDFMGIDADYIPLMNIKIAEGRNFSEALVTDTSESVIINATAARNFGWSDPIGKKFYFNPHLTGEEEEPYTMNVVGVVEDFHIYSLREKIEPLFISNDPDGIDVISLKIAESDITGTLKRLGDLWSEMVPTMPFNYLFLDASINDQYQSEAGLKRLTRYFSVFAIFIGCLGLFGLSAFTAANRTKEIGIRKVLGATVPGIVGLLSKEFTLLIILSSVIAYPIAWTIINKWLDTFAFQVGFSWIMASAVSLITLVLALLTVSFQSIKAALSNPVDSLHYE
ncbi:MAG: ABC transporter permease [Candidatus Neomarinimicrobiota bacterium]